MAKKPCGNEDISNNFCLQIQRAKVTQNNQSTSGFQGIAR